MFLIVMELIEPYRSITGIGFDLGDGIMNFIIKKNSLLPISNTVKFINDYDNIKILKIYEGINNLVKNNIFYKDFEISNNTLYFIEVIQLSINIIILRLKTRLNTIYSQIIKLKLNSTFINEEGIDINNIKLKFIFRQLKQKIFQNIRNNSVNFNDNLKNKIKSRLNEIDIDLDNMNNQQIIDKINTLKNKFLL